MQVPIVLALCGWFVASPDLGLVRIGLAWNTTHSPDSVSLVYVAEERVGDDSDYTLTLMTGLAQGRPRVTYSLTPRCGRAVESPSGRAIGRRGGAGHSRTASGRGRCRGLVGGDGMGGGFRAR